MTDARSAAALEVGASFAARECTTLLCACVARVGEPKYVSSDGRRRRQREPSIHRPPAPARARDGPLARVAADGPSSTFETRVERGGSFTALPPSSTDPGASLSIAVADAVDAELLGDRVREALGARARDVEALEILAETPGAALPPSARERLGLQPGQKNLLVRLVLRAVGRTLTDSEANELRDEVYAAVHEGTRGEWAARGRRP